MTAEVFDQRVATDPKHSAWVRANAGSGKTHVLVDRIARLLLSGSAPDRLMCLTFTRAAASEMSTRLFKRLGEWTLLPDDALAAQLTDVNGEQPSRQDMERARRLFADALESPGGLRIQTIHAFCERLLKRFPLEGKVVPQFEVLDERATEQLLEEAKEAVLMRGALSDPDLADSIAALTEYAGEERFDVLMRGIVGDRGWIEPFVRGKSAVELRAALWRKVGLEPGVDQASISGRCSCGARSSAVGAGGQLSAQRIGDRQGARPGDGVVRTPAEPRYVRRPLRGVHDAKGRAEQVARDQGGVEGSSVARGRARSVRRCGDGRADAVQRALHRSAIGGAAACRGRDAGRMPHDQRPAGDAGLRRSDRAGGRFVREPGRCVDPLQARRGHRSYFGR